MATWRAYSEQSGTKTAYLRLGSYQSDEAGLEPSQYSGTFSSSDGILMTTTGSWYVDTDSAVNIEIQGAATVYIGDFSSDTDTYLKIDVLEGEATTETHYSQGGEYKTTTYSGKSGLMRGKGVALNAVTDAGTAKSPADGELTIYASDKIVIESKGMTKFTADSSVSITNKEASTTGTEQRDFNMGFVNSIVFGFQAKTVPGVYTSAMVGERLQLRPTDLKVSINDFSYNITKNELLFIKQDNEGVGAFIASLFNIYGCCFQKNAPTVVKQSTMGNKTKGSSIALKLAGLKRKSISSRVGLSNTM